MKRGLILIAAVLGFVGMARAEGLSEAEAKEGFISLFNGKDFSGWRFDDKSALPAKLPANWKVEDGVIKLSGGGSPHLASQWDYEDFDVRFEWRAMRKNYNSGFYIRSGRKVGANQINLAKGAEGGFIGGKIKGAHTVPDLQKPAMEWNTWRVRAAGDKVTFWCNDKLAWEGTGLKDRRGYLGLQAEGAPMEFRNIRIKEIGYDDLRPLDKWGPTRIWKQGADGLTSAGDPVLLHTRKRDYRDYVLRLEYLGGKSASGRILLRGNRTARASVELSDRDEGSGGLNGGRVKPVKKADNPAGQWNYLEVRLLGGKATVWLNGVVVLKDHDLKALDERFPEAGPIALQQMEKPFHFRNLRIKEIRRD